MGISQYLPLVSSFLHCCLSLSWESNPTLVLETSVISPKGIVVLACILLLLTPIYHLISKFALSLIPTFSYLAKLTPFQYSWA